MATKRKFKYRAWVADFETSTEIWFNDKGYTEIWGFALTDCQINHKTPNDMTDSAIVYTNFNMLGEPFDNFLKVLDEKCLDGDKIYFHNLKFDGNFLLYNLLQRGFLDVTNAENCHNNNRKKVYEKSFSALVSSNSWYTIKVNLGSKTLEFRDSVKRIPMTVKRMAREYRLPILKGDIDYNRNPQLPVTEEENKYMRHDVLIVAEVLRQQYQEGFVEITTASYAFASWKRWLKTRGLAYDEIFPGLSAEDEGFCRRGYEGGEVYCNPRYSGRVIGDPLSTEMIGETWDINSMYPAKMSAAGMPYGEAMHTSFRRLGLSLDYSEWKKWRGGKYRYFIEVRKLKAKVKPGRIPSVGVAVGFGKRRYPEEFEIYEKVFADIRFEMILRDYDIEEIICEKVIYFKARYDLFFDYIKGIVDEKNRASIDGNIMRKALSKVKMNSLYGKFGQKPESTSTFFTWNEEDEELESNNYEADCGYKYIPVAAIITAEARNLLISQANKFGSDGVAYMDTDSIHVINSKHSVVSYRRRPRPGKCEKELKLSQMNESLTQDELIEKLREFEEGRPNEVWCDEFDLGAFKVEGEFACAKWLRAKTYFEGNYASEADVLDLNKAIANEEWNGEDFVIPENSVNPGYNLIACIKGAGIPDETKREITVENFQIGLTLGGKLAPKRVKGGVILVETQYQIKEDGTILINNDLC